jgi:hypothetical protein
MTRAAAGSDELRGRGGIGGGERKDIKREIER